MDPASPATELLGFCVSLLAIFGAIGASVIFLRDKGSGPKIMLIGSILSFIGMAPKGMEQVINYYSRNGYEPPELSGALYYTFWNWLPTTAGLVFAAGLLITALQRRGLSKRITELECILSTIETQNKK